MTILTPIRGAGKPDEAAETLRKLQANLESAMALQAVLAKITRAKYESLMAEGFSAEQALELCK